MRRLPILAAALVAAPLGLATAQPSPQGTSPGTAPQPRGAVTDTTRQNIPGQSTVPGMTTTQGSTPTGRAEVVSTEQFLKLAAMSDRFETASGRLAEQHAASRDVKRFAEHMVRDHMKTTQEMQALIQQIPGSGAGVATPLPNGRESTPANSPGGRMTNAQGGPQHEGMDAEHTQLLQQLDGLRGAEFDRMYMTQQVAAHQKAVDMFAAYAQSGDNAALKQWAGKTLPTLREHLADAQKVQRELRS